MLLKKLTSYYWQLEFLAWLTRRKTTCLMLESVTVYSVGRLWFSPQTRGWCSEHIYIRVYYFQIAEV